MRLAVSVAAVFAARRRCWVCEAGGEREPRSAARVCACPEEWIERAVWVARKRFELPGKQSGVMCVVAGCIMCGHN